MITQEDIENKKKELLELETKFKEQKETQVYQEIKYKNKIFRIYVWEDKKIRDFPMPKGFDFAKFNDFIELYNNDKVELEVWKYYYLKHFSTKQQTKDYCLSGLCLGGNLSLSSSYCDLDGSSSNGGIVVEMEKSK